MTIQNTNLWLCFWLRLRAIQNTHCTVAADRRRPGSHFVLLYFLILPVGAVALPSGHWPTNSTADYQDDWPVNRNPPNEQKPEPCGLSPRRWHISTFMDPPPTS